MRVVFKHIQHLGLETKSKEYVITQSKSIQQILLDDGIDLELIKSVTFLVNGMHEKSDYVVKEGDCVSIIPIVSGG